jgi:hypothetical protein
MDQLPFNTGAFNDSGKIATVVYLPDATVEIALALSERISVSMSGTTGMSITPTGDISKISVFGPTLLEFGFEPTGDLATYRTAYLGDVAVTFGFDPSGMMSGLRVLPSAVTGMGIELEGVLTNFPSLAGKIDFGCDATGTLASVRSLGDGVVEKHMTLVGGMYGYQYLKGTINSGRALTGDLTVGVNKDFGNQTINVDRTLSGSLTIGRKVLIPYGLSAKGLALTGLLTQTHRLAGVASMDINPTGAMTQTQYLSGSVSMSLGIIGELANNASGTELDRFLMTRRKTNREMTR